MGETTLSYLHNRRAQVQLDGLKSKKVLLRHGVPQGGVLSSILFLVFINDLVAELPHRIKVAMYADDLVMWCIEESAIVATKIMQRAIDALISWTNQWFFIINTEKCSTTLFTLSTVQKADIIKINGESMKEDKQHTYLGVTFHDRLTWKQHINKAATKARRKLAILRKLSGTTWGATGKILSKVYQQAIGSYLEYGSAAWCPASNMGHDGSNEIYPNSGNGKKENSNTERVKRYKGLLVWIQADKFLCMPNHPMKDRFRNLAMGRLKGAASK
jgi:hypothetical protein